MPKQEEPPILENEPEEEFGNLRELSADDLEKKFREVDKEFTDSPNEFSKRLREAILKESTRREINHGRR